MESPVHSMHKLFAQLGQASDERAIAQFIETWRPLGNDIQLHEADCWTPSQASFLRQALLDDADWAEVVDALNVGLHARH